MKDNNQKLRSLKRRQAMLRVDAPENSWASILDEADLNYSATIVQLNSGYISKDKLNQIEQVISRREGLGVT